MRKKLYGAIALGVVVLGSSPAWAIGGPCNGRVDVNCSDTHDNNNNCTVYVQALKGCQIGT